MEEDPSLEVVGFVTEETLVVALANVGLRPMTRTLGFQGAPSLALASAETTLSSTVSVFEGFDDLTRLSYGPGVWVDSTSPEYFDGDEARLNAEPGGWFLLGEGSPISEFSLTAWRWSGLTSGDLVVEGSEDLDAWSPLTLVESVVPGDWDEVVLTATGLSGARYVRVTWEEADPSWALEVGEATLTVKPDPPEAPETGWIEDPKQLEVLVPAESTMVLHFTR